MPLRGEAFIAQKQQNLFKDRNIAVDDGICDSQRLTIAPFFHMRQLLSTGNDQNIVYPRWGLHTGIGSYKRDHIKMTLSEPQTRIADN